MRQAGGRSTAAAKEGPVVGPDLVLWLDAQDIHGGGDADVPADEAATGTWADKSGRRLTFPRFMFTRDFENGLAWVRIKDRFGYINPSGKVVFMTPGPLRDGLRCAWDKGKCGFQDGRGQWVLPARYDEAGDFSEGQAAVRIGTKWGAIDRRGRLAIPLRFDEVGARRDNATPVRVGEAHGLLDTRGQFLAKPIYKQPVVYSAHVVVVVRSKQVGVLDRKTRAFAPLPGIRGVHPFRGGMARVWDGKAYGYRNDRGKVVVKPQFDRAADFLDGVGQVQIGRRRGQVDKDGTIKWHDGP